MNFWCLLATLGPIGYFPYFPGTVASILGLVLRWELGKFCSLEGEFFLIFILLILGITAADFSEKFFNQQDDRRIVIDELIGILIATTGIKSWIYLLLAFFFFRVFDWTKVLGIRYFQKLPGGYGIVADDVAAGIYARVLILICQYGKLSPVA